MLLTHLWERINLSKSNSSVSPNNHMEGPICQDYGFYEPYGSSDNSSTNRYEMGQACETSLNKAMSFPSVSSYCNPEHECTRARFNTFYKHDYYPQSVLSKTLLMSQMKERNHCWAFSSMPEIPVTLQDDEFLVDAGIRMPVQLSSCHPGSRIPQPRDIMYRNRLSVIGNAERSCSSERISSTNLDKGKSKRHFSMHEDCLKTRSSSLDQTKINRCSVNYEEMARQRGKCSLDEQHCVKDDARSKRYPAPPGKLRMSCGEQQKAKSFEEKSKRSSLIMDKEKSRFSQPKNVIDRSKRHSVNYTTHVADMKDTKQQKFKRHSLEVTESNGSERMGRLKRNFTLDVNHNQGASKISSLRSAFASGSRTAPVTRASSPIRVAPRFNFEHQLQDDIGDYSMERQLGKFSSSDEEVDKLCIRFAYLDPPNIRDDRASSRASRLPVWMRRKKP